MNRYRITDQDGNLVGEFVGQVRDGQIVEVAPPADKVHIAPGTFDQFRMRARVNEVRVLANTYDPGVDVQVLQQVLDQKNDPQGYQAEMLRRERDKDPRYTTEDIANLKIDHAMGLVIVEDGYVMSSRVLQDIKELGYEVISKTALWRLECSAHVQGMRENLTRKGMLPGLAHRTQQGQELVELLTRQTSPEPSKGKFHPKSFIEGSGNRADRRASAAKARRANKKRK